MSNTDGPARMPAEATSPATDGGGRAMSAGHRVLLLGATGRTGRLVLQQLLNRGVVVRAIVRSAARLPEGSAQKPGLTVIEADLLSMTEENLEPLLRGCDAVISCLGHTNSVNGILGPPRDLVTRVTTTLCRGIEALQPATPVKFILMSSVSVDRPAGLDARRGAIEKAVLSILRAIVPLARDNQRAADFLCNTVGTTAPFVQWVTVRPDTLREGDVSAYALHESLVSGLFAPGKTNMANVARFMCELVTRPSVWDDWRGGLPVIVNVDSK
jgi:hypothetical protein